jgi:membrane protein required for colicin V production
MSLGMTALDILVLVLVGGIGVRGFSNGFVVEATSIIAWLAGITAVKLFHSTVATALLERVGTASGAAMLAFFLTFGIAFGIVRFLGNRLGSASKGSALGPFDRVLGAGFGAVKGLTAATLLFLVATFAYDTVFGGKSARPEWMTTSRSYPLLNATSGALANFIEERRKSGGAAPVVP